MVRLHTGTQVAPHHHGCMDKLRKKSRQQGYTLLDIMVTLSITGILFVPDSIPYNFSIDSTTAETERWWGWGRALGGDLRHFYIDETGVVLGSLAGPPTPP